MLDRRRPAASGWARAPRAPAPPIPAGPRPFRQGPAHTSTCKTSVLSWGAAGVQESLAHWTDACERGCVLPGRNGQPAAGWASAFPGVGGFSPQPAKCRGDRDAVGESAELATHSSCFLVTVRVGWVAWDLPLGSVDCLEPERKGAGKGVRTG